MLCDTPVKNHFHDQDPKRPLGAFGALWNIRFADIGLFRLNVGRPDYLAPLPDFFGYEGSEIGRRAGKDHAAEVSKLSLQLGIGKASIDFLVEVVDDLAGRFPGGADSEKTTRFVTRNKFAYAREVRQRL
jgi:hypothetical protein